MKSRTSTTLAIAAALLVPRTHAAYKLADDYTGGDFFSMFDFYNRPDPTKGTVTYVDQETAIESGLVGFFNDDLVKVGKTSEPTVFVGVDYTNKVEDLRPSVRLTSKKTYDTALLVVDILHMPAGADGLWPALWTLGNATEWPSSGEIDILEGVHKGNANSITLHTDSGCSLSQTPTALDAYTGHLKTPNCDVKAPDQSNNAGCGISMGDSTEMHASQANYGNLFNANGGGTFAVEWTNSHIRAWFYPRGTNSTVWPKSLFSDSPDVSEFGTPVADFAGECNFAEKFKKQQIIINTAFCGEWAGNTWESDGAKERTGVETCEQYVRENPEAFKSAYWEFRSLKVYTESGQNDQEKAPAGRPLSDFITRDVGNRLNPKKRGLLPVKDANRVNKIARSSLSTSAAAEQVGVPSLMVGLGLLVVAWLI